MITLSTSYLWPERGFEEERLQRLLDLPVEAFELGFRTPATEIRPLGTELRRAHRQIPCLHNYCPVPPAVMKPGGRLPRSADSDCIPFSSLDSEDRRAAAAATLESLKWAARFESRAVVVTCGRMALDLPVARLTELMAAGTRGADEASRLRVRLLARRKERAPAHLDAVRSTLDRVLKEAERLEISVALKNRRELHELPNLEELLMLLEDFRGAPIGSWFDPAHARTQEFLGIASVAEIRDALAPSLLGVHLHDRQELHDGLPPGAGELDLRTEVPDEPLPAVILCQPGTPDEDIVTGIRHLEATVDDPFDAL